MSEPRDRTAYMRSYMRKRRAAAASLAERAGFSKADHRSIIAAYLAGEPVDAIAARFGCSRTYPGALARRRAHGGRVEQSGVSTQEIGRLAALRKARKLSQRRLAARIGVMAVSLRCWESGKFAPLAFNLSCWREALGVRP